MSWYQQLFQDTPEYGFIFSFLVAAGLGIVTLLRLRRGIQWGSAQWKKYWPAVRAQMRSVHRGVAHWLGLVTLKDLEQSRSKASGPPASGRRDIIRFGMNWSLSEGFWLHAGLRDPLHVEDNVITVIIEGPFCARCRMPLSHTVRSAYAPPTSVIQPECETCGYRWSSSGKTEDLRNTKRQLYIRLDAELRRTKAISDEGERPLT